MKLMMKDAFHAHHSESVSFFCGGEEKKREEK
jgi:hypothetical protein